MYINIGGTLGHPPPSLAFLLKLPSIIIVVLALAIEHYSNPNGKFEIFYFLSNSLNAPNFKFSH